MTDIRRGIFGRNVAHTATLIDKFAEFSASELETAALRMLPNFGGFFSSVAEADKTLSAIADQRLKYADYPSKRMWRHINGWLDYYERHARDGRRCAVHNERVSLLMNKIGEKDQ